MDIFAQVDTTLNTPGQDCRGPVFGLGGREAAGKQMEYWLAKIRD